MNDIDLAHDARKAEAERRFYGSSSPPNYDCVTGTPLGWILAPFVIMAVGAMYQGACALLSLIF